jgi:hypothetical protein
MIEIVKSSVGRNNKVPTSTVPDISTLEASYALNSVVRMPQAEDQFDDIYHVIPSDNPTLSEIVN